MLRIEGVPAHRASLPVRFAYWMSRRIVGKVTTPLQVMAHHFWIFQGYGGFEFALQRAKKVDPKLKTLASLRAASMVGCPF